MQVHAGTDKKRVTGDANAKLALVRKDLTYSEIRMDVIRSTVYPSAVLSTLTCFATHIHKVLNTIQHVWMMFKIIPFMIFQ